jgi:hypothetical protein
LPRARRRLRHLDVQLAVLLAFLLLPPSGGRKQFGSAKMHIAHSPTLFSILNSQPTNFSIKNPQPSKTENLTIRPPSLLPGAVFGPGDRGLFGCWLGEFPGAFRPGTDLAVLRPPPSPLADRVFGCRVSGCSGRLRPGFSPPLWGAFRRPARAVPPSLDN